MFQGHHDTALLSVTHQQGRVPSGDILPSLLVRLDHAIDTLDSYGYLRFMLCFDRYDNVGKPRIVNLFPQILGYGEEFNIKYTGLVDPNVQVQISEMKPSDLPAKGFPEYIILLTSNSGHRRRLGCPRFSHTQFQLKPTGHQACRDGACKQKVNYCNCESMLGQCCPRVKGFPPFILSVQPYDI